MQPISAFELQPYLIGFIGILLSTLGGIGIWYIRKDESRHSDTEQRVNKIEDNIYVALELLRSENTDLRIMVERLSTEHNLICARRGE